MKIILCILEIAVYLFYKNRIKQSKTQINQNHQNNEMNN